jgi:flagellar biosynthesis chaperone FliJ
MEINERIMKLQRELQQHQARLNQAQQIVTQEMNHILKKSGALEVLQELQEKPKKPKLKKSK